MFAFFASLLVSIVLGELPFRLQKSPEARIGPRLESLKVQVSSYGAVIARVWGSMRLAGNIIWAKDLEEVPLVYQVTVGRSLLGQKKKQTVVEYRYFANVAVAVCAGPITGIRKIWANDRLIFDLSEDNLGPVGVGWNIRVYLGNETQDPDPLILATEGASATPAFRGTAYVVFERFALEEWGNQLPTFTFEVVDGIAGYAEPFTTSISTFGGGVVPTPFDIVHVSGQYKDYIDRDTYQYVKTFSGDPSSYLYPGWLNYDATRNAIWIAVQSYTDPFTGASVTGPIACDANTFTYIKGSAPGTGFGQCRNLWYVASTDQILFNDESGGGAFTGTKVMDAETHAWVQVYESSLDSVASYVGQVAVRQANPTQWVFNSITYAGSTVAQPTAPTPEAWIVDGPTLVVVDLEATAATAIPLGYYVYAPVYDQVNDYVWVVKGNATHTGTSNTLEAWDCATRSVVQTVTAGAATAVGSHGLCYDPAGQLILMDGDGDLVYVSVVTFTVTDTQTPPAGLGSFSGSDKCCVVDSSLLWVNTSGELSVVPLHERLAATGKGLDVVVGEICSEAGLAAGDIDVTALASSTVHGYVLTGQTSARKAIEDLQVPYAFDSVDTGAKVKFVKRGGAVAATIGAEDLVAGDDSGGEPGALMPITRAAERDLPAEVTFTSLARARDYANHTQYARRLTRYSEQVLNIELPLVFSADQGAQVCDVLLANVWRERTGYRFGLGPRWWSLEPTDVVDVTDLLGNTHRLRLTGITVGGNGVAACEGVLEDAAQYTSTAKGADGGAPPGVIETLGPTMVMVFDLPALTLSQTGFPRLTVLVASRATDWRGADLQLSFDGGETFPYLATVATEEVFGFATTTLGAGRADVVDWSQSVTVALTDGTLSSKTHAEVVGGKYTNLCILGDEVLKFVTATVSGAGVVLTGLMRGLYGTEWAMDAHSVGERFALLTGTAFSHEFGADLQGTELIATAQSVGMPPNSRQSDALLATCAAVEPVAPYYLSGNRDASNHWNLRWRRRERGVQWANLQDVPLLESAENYTLKVYTTDWATLKRTVSVSAAATYQYTSSMQTTDFGAAVKAFGLEVAQVSDDATIAAGTATRVLINAPVATHAQDLIRAGHVAGETPPTGYTKKGDTADFTAETVVDTRSSRNRTAIKLSSATASGYKKMVLSWDGPGTATDGEVTALCNFSGTGQSSTAANGIGPAVRISGADGALNMYLLQLDVWGKSQVELWKLVAGTWTYVARYTGFTQTSDGLYWLKLRAIGSLIQCKAWAEGADEPTDWQITATDTSVAGAGLFGLHAGDPVPDYYCYHLLGETY